MHLDFEFWLTYFQRLGAGEVFTRTLMIALACIWIEYISKIRQWNRKPDSKKIIIDNNAAEHGFYAHVILGTAATVIFGRDSQGAWLPVLELLTLFFMYAIFSGPLHMILRGIISRYNKYNNGDSK